MSLHPSEEPFRLGTGEPKSAPLEWFDDVRPILTCRHLIKGLLDVGALSLVFGQPGSAKTFFCMDVAFHIATGRPWRGRRVRRAAVLYLAAEGGTGATNRLVALKLAHNVQNVPFAIRRAGLDLLRADADLQLVCALAREVQDRFPDLPLLIVVDTLSRAMAGGDENSATDMTALIRNLDIIREKTGAHVLVVHHAGKDSTKGARGHSSLRAATDTEIELQGGEGKLRAAKVTKQRDIAGEETFTFTLVPVALGEDEDGDPVQSCVVEASDEEAPQKGRALGVQQRLLLETMDQLLTEPDGWRMNPGGAGFPEPGRFKCVEYTVLKAAFERRTSASNQRAAFKDAFDALRDKRKFLCLNGGLVWRVGKWKSDTEAQE